MKSLTAIGIDLILSKTFQHPGPGRVHAGLLSRQSPRNRKGRLEILGVQINGCFDAEAVEIGYEPLFRPIATNPDRRN